MAEVLRFPTPEAPDQKPVVSAEIVTIPTVAYAFLGPEVNVGKAAKACAARLARGDYEGAARWWRAHVAALRKGGQLAFTEDAVSRMLEGYTAAVRSALDRLKAEAEGGR